MTECFPITVLGVGSGGAPGSAGSPNPNFDVRLVDTDDEEVAAGEVGEIIARPRAPHVMFEGYSGRPEATLAQMRNLWFHTGDLGRFDEHGNLWYVDRKKDAIRRRGENISSFEVERALATHPAVAEIAVIAVPSPVGEEDVKACLVLAPDAELDPIEFMDFCGEKLPFFAVPRYLEFVDELPRNATGRILKFRLRDDPVNARTWDREAAGYKVKR
jgi:crotonobetaine/carnitine-CoA ligase